MSDQIKETILPPRGLAFGKRLALRDLGKAIEPKNDDELEGLECMETLLSALYSDDEMTIIFDSPMPQVIELYQACIRTTYGVNEAAAKN